LGDFGISKELKDETKAETFIGTRKFFKKSFRIVIQ